MHSKQHSKPVRGDGTDLETEFAAFVEKSDKELENVYAKENALTESNTKIMKKLKKLLKQPASMPMQKKKMLSLMLQLIM